ncbi:MAG: hypothetical protein WCP14_01990 [bacterium]
MSKLGFIGRCFRHNCVKVYLCKSNRRREIVIHITGKRCGPSSYIFYFGAQDQWKSLASNISYRELKEAWQQLNISTVESEYQDILKGFYKLLRKRGVWVKPPAFEKK